MVIQTSDNKFGVAKWIVDSTAGLGTHTTIAAALTSASSGDTIFIRPGTYTENITLKAGVNLSAFECDALTPNVTISGTCSFTAAGTVTISGIRLASNGAQFLSVTGSAASIVNLNNCYLTTAFDPGITFSSSSSSAAISINYCQGNISASARRFFDNSSAGNLFFNYSRISNSGLSTTKSTCSAGTVTLRSAEIFFPIDVTTSGLISATLSIMNCLAINTTALTCGGSGGVINLCSINAGTDPAVSVGATVSLTNCSIGSSNTNAITGAGTLGYSGLIFTSTSYKINTTTQTGGTIQGGRTTQAPSAGFLGERFEQTATDVAMTTGTAKTIASITLTPGVWDVSALATATATGGTTLIQAFTVNISTTNNTIVGTKGLETFQTNITGGITIVSGSVPALRVTIDTSATYYLVCNVFYTSTTAPTNGRISATRVG